MIAMTGPFYVSFIRWSRIALTLVKKLLDEISALMLCSVVSNRRLVQWR